MLRTASFVTACLLLNLPTLTSARTWYITPDGLGDAPTIQAGVDSAAAGDTVLLAPGKYLEHDIALIPGVVLASETGDPETTVIDAGQQGSVILGFGLDAYAVIDAVTITGGLAQWGAGLYFEEGTPRVTRCRIVGNVADLDNGWFAGGAFCYDASPTFEDCLFRGNMAPTGGAVSCVFGRPSFLRCTFDGNAAVQGGAMSIDTCSPTISGCTFVGNYALGSDPDAAAAIMFFALAAPEIDHTIIAFSPFGRAFQAYCDWWPPQATLRCCNVFGNAGGDWDTCEIEDQLGQDGNFSADPLFCDFDAENYAIRIDSPCAPHAGHSGCVLIGAMPVGCGAVPIEARTWGQIKGAYR